MKLPEFAERQYEMCFHLELSSGSSGPFVPTQPLEWHLGIDAATNPPDAHRIWRILNVSIPRRMTLSPAIWPELPRKFHSAITGSVVSLFIQFKVPKYNDATKSKYRVHFGSPYFEVAITRHQQDRLADLERCVESRAIVRYASPAFWTRTDFDRHAAQRSILAQSAYMIPSEIGSHKKWMYAGPMGKTLLNPDPKEVESEGWEKLIGRMARRAQEESLRVHISRLAQSLRETQPNKPFDEREATWLSAVREYTRLSREDEAYLVDLRTVVDAAEQANTTWVVMLSLDDDTHRLFDMFWEGFEMGRYHNWYYGF